MGFRVMSRPVRPIPGMTWTLKAYENERENKPENSPKQGKALFKFIKKIKINKKTVSQLIGLAVLFGVVEITYQLTKTEEQPFTA